jgi:hypothetical protein
MRQSRETRTRVIMRVPSGAQTMPAADGAGAGALAGALAGAAAVTEDSGTVLTVFDDELVARLTPAGTDPQASRSWKHARNQCQARRVSVMRGCVTVGSNRSHQARCKDTQPPLPKMPWRWPSSL